MVIFPLSFFLRSPSGRWQRPSALAARTPKNAGREGSSENRSEEHTSELQSLMRISYAVFCLKKKNNTIIQILILISHNLKIHLHNNVTHTSNIPTLIIN